MIVMKFGGSSLRDATRIRAVAEIIQSSLATKPIIVLSALGNSTDLLVRACDHARGEDPSLAEEIAASPTSQDSFEGPLREFQESHLQIAKELGIAVDLNEFFAELRNALETLRSAETRIEQFTQRARAMSIGERVSVRMVAEYFRHHGHSAQAYDSWDLGFISDSNPLEARVLEESYSRIRSAVTELDSNVLPFVTGFLAKDEQGLVTTLGRGGSDLTASIIGAAVGAEEIQYWKDVDGILSSDPNVVENAQLLPRVSFEEAAELAYSGARILHPLSIQPAMRAQVPVRIRNSYNPLAEGTLILREAPRSDSALRAITCKRDIMVLDLVSSRMLGQYGFLADVFSVFRRHEISVDMLATSEVSVSLTLNRGFEPGEALRDLGQFAQTTMHRGKAILTLIGDVSRSSEILDRTFGVLFRIGVNAQMVSQGASKVNIGLIVEDEEVEKCIRALHEHFFGQESVSSVALSA